MADPNRKPAPSAGAQPTTLEEGGAAVRLLTAKDGGSGSYGAVSGVSGGATPSQSPTSLPDLTDRLKEAGIYGEYYAYRQKYLQWRRGGSQGASGELTHEALAASPSPGMFEYWYPSPCIFKWRFTIAYWKGILFLVGSLLFTFSCCLQYWGGPGGYGMIARPSALGAVFYTLGCYAAYLQLINIPAGKEEYAVYLIPDVAEIYKYAQLSSVIGTLSYFVGAILFNVACVVVLYEELSPHVKRYAVALPNLVGSSLFLVGSISEITHNRIFRNDGATTDDPVWWVAVLNTVGSANFVLGSLPPLAKGWPDADRFVAFNFGMGAACFIISSILMLVMWRGNDFGLSLLKQLNFHMRAEAHVTIARQPNGGSSGSHGGQHVGVRIHMPPGATVNQEATSTSQPRFSLRGTAFIVLYCWFAFVAIMDCLCKHQWYIHSSSRHIMRHALDLAMQMFVVLLIALVLVLHSAVTDVPDEQPFHCALITLRCVLLAGATIQTVMFVSYLQNPHYDDA